MKKVLRSFLEETFISIVDEKGKVVKEEVVASESKAIAD